MSLKRNILASYASQIYVTLIGIVMVPLYVKYMGAEAYGLVGFFAMLQAWFQLLDMGLTPTMARETARYQGGGMDALSLRRLLRALEGVFVGVALLGALVIGIGAPWIASHWLNVQHLSMLEVQLAVTLMGMIVGLRWICGLYRGAISGLERLVWLNGFNAAIATFRFVLVIPLFIYVGATITHFFVFQIVVALVELTALVAQAYRLLPSVRVSEGARPISPWDWNPLRSLLKFSLSIAFTSSVWVLVTQTDKLVLSKMLPLADYGYFTMAVLVSGGVLVLSGPISGALIPRMTRMHTEGNQQELVRIYRQSTQFVAAIAISVALVLAVFAEPILWAWTGNKLIAQRTAPTLTLYALGNGVLAVSAFPAYIQYAKGDLKLHVIGNAVFVVLFIPALVISARKYGVIGAGYAWVVTNSLYFFLWIPLVHRRFIRGLHWRWLFRDVGVILMLALIGVGFGEFMLNAENMRTHDRVQIAVSVALVGMLSLFFAVIGTEWVWKIFQKTIFCERRASN